MKYTRNLKYISPLSDLSNRIQILKLFDGFEILTFFVTSLSVIQTENIIKNIKINDINKEIKEHKDYYSGFSSDQYYLTLDSNLEELRKLESKIKNVEFEFSVVIKKSISFKTELKNKHLILWGAYLDIKKEYGISQSLRYKKTAKDLNKINHELFNIVCLFTNPHSFCIYNLLSKNSNKLKDQSDKYKKIITDFLGENNDCSLKKECLKQVPTFILMNIINEIKLSVNDINNEIILLEISDTNMDSDRKKLKKLLNINSKIDLLNHSWEKIKKNEPNYKSISTS